MITFNYQLQCINFETSSFFLLITIILTSVKPSLWFVVKTMIVMVISWLAAIVMAIMIALFLSKLGRGMSWFAYPLVTLPLYGVSAVLAIGETNVQWMKWVSTS